MVTTANAAFNMYLATKTPKQAERDNARRHRVGVERAMESRLSCVDMFETGSLSHGTAVAGHCDADYFLWLKLPKPSADVALASVRDALKSAFPRTYVRVSRPAVKIYFVDDGGQMEIVPSYYRTTTPSQKNVFDIPDPATSGWMASSPSTHLAYVNQANTTAPGAKGLARLLKAWKYDNRVPISSFYLEMRAAKWALDHKPVCHYWDIATCLEHLADNRLPAVNDPSDVSLGRIYPCSTDRYKVQSQSKVETAARRARRALNYEQNGKTADAISEWVRIFGTSFPSYG
jgi:Second Messenger Oligonucleotide or Dinucleotide Synthetase domain